MRTTIGLMAGCVLALAGAAAAGEADDLKALAGTWTGTAVAFDGEDVPADVAGRLQFIFKDGKVTMRGGLAKAGPNFIAVARQDTYQVKLGVDGATKTIDLVPDRPGGRTIPGIYKLADGKMTIVLNFKNGDRPTAFESKEGTGVGVFGCEKKAKK